MTAHSGNTGSTPTVRSRISGLWDTVLTAIPGARPAAEDVHAPVSEPQPPVQPVAPEEPAGWPTWRNPR